MTEQLIETLKNGSWIFKILANPVKQKISQALSSSANSLDTISTTYLTTAYYNPGGIPTVLESKKPVALTIITGLSGGADYFNKQISNLFSPGVLAVPDDININLEIWLQEFIEFCLKDGIYKELPEFLEYAILVSGVKFRGASQPHLLSSLFLNIKPNDSKFDSFVSIVHESAHQELFLINFIDRLINSNFDYNLIHAPYQNKMRPPIGRLHSLHALFRMNQFARLYAPEHINCGFFAEKFTENLKSFDTNELTIFSKTLLSEVYEPFSKTL